MKTTNSILSETAMTAQGTQDVDRTHRQNIKEKREANRNMYTYGIRMGENEGSHLVMAKRRTARG